MMSAEFSQVIAAETQRNRIVAAERYRVAKQARAAARAARAERAAGIAGKGRNARSARTTA